MSREENLDILLLGEDLEAIHWQDGTTTLSIGRSALVELSQDEAQKLGKFLLRACTGEDCCTDGVCEVCSCCSRGHCTNETPTPE